MAHVRDLVIARSTAEPDLATAAIARDHGHSWAAIGAMLGTSGELLTDFRQLG